ncbi:MAG: mandelate racemase/muconate lactonizing enzyme family protein [Bryobacteraceae bacterium]|nr:mandelate racemase/muconate lactonizing enzyme family protein [Bryobacteraceae bacterium]
MKIRDVRAFGLTGKTPEGGWSSELQPEDCVHTIIAVLTDEGLTGWGSVFTSGDLVKASLAVLRPLFLGENALEPERVSEKLHQSTFWLGRGGSITHTISGIDIALWDLLGKACGQPVGRLIGGRYKERVRPYASLLMRQPEQMADELLPVKAQGFRAFKIGWGPFGKVSLAVDEAIVRAARDAVGEESLLMVDAGASDAFWPQGYKWALRTADMLDAYGVSWFEEPLTPDSLEEFQALRAASSVPIAGGEVLTRRQAFQPWLEGRAFDIVQPDVTKCGGLSEQRRIAWTAREHGVRFIPHGWNTAVGLASDLQVASAFADTDLVEYLTGSAFIDDLVTEPWRLDADGMLPIPAVPGLGVELRMDALAELSRVPVGELSELFP